MNSILLFGSYDLHQNCNITKIEALQSTTKVKQCRVDFPDIQRQSQQTYNVLGLLKLGIFILSNQIKLISKYLTIGNHGSILVMYPAQIDLGLAKIISIFTGKKLVFYPFISLYQTLVEQRKFLKKGFKSKVFFYIDKFSCLIADKVILDSDVKIEYYKNVFGLPKEKFVKIFIGAPETFTPTKLEKHKNFTVLFYGSFVQHADTKLLFEAINKLKGTNVFFRLIGRKENFKQFVGMDNVKIIDFLPQKELAEEIERVHVSLSFLSDNPKNRVEISSRVFEGIAMGTPVINYIPCAITELLTHGESSVFCDSTVQSITDSILLLKNNPDLRAKISWNARKISLENCSYKVISKKLLEVLND